MSTIAVNNITDAAGGNTATINGTTPTADSLQGFRNRIINGDMRISQQAQGAAVTGVADRPVDQFLVRNVTDGAYSAQQDSSAPAGFVNSLKVTITTADASVGATQYLLVRNRIEGLNVSDLGWGTADAQAVTLSFWVRSSLTGTFGVVINNSGYTRSYPSTYTISAANTWEYKTVTVPGDTTGTWLTTNGIGMEVDFDLGVGSTYSGTAGSWTAAGDIFGTTGATDVVSTLNATWYITGVQLEAGSVATPFERRPYGTELALCQRYYQQIGSIVGCASSADGFTGAFQFFTPMRATPTVGLSAALSITDTNTADYTQSGINISIVSGTRANQLGMNIVAANFTGLTNNRLYITIPAVYSNGIVVVSAEL